MMHEPIFRHGIGNSSSLLHGNLGDARLVNIFLEQAHLFFADPLSHSFYQADWAFFPYPWSGVMSEIMTSSAVFYLPWRWVGMGPFESYQLWFLLHSIANFVAFLWVARRLGAHWLGALAGAWLFAYSGVRGAYLAHPQLIPHFWTPLFFYQLVRICVDTNGAQRARSWFFASVLLAMQIWSSFYLGWFALFALLMGMIVALPSAPARQIMWSRLRSDLRAIVAAGGVFIVVLAPMLYGYANVAAELGTRTWPDIKGGLPYPSTYFIPHQPSIYRFMFDYIVSHAERLPVEFSMFPGFVAYASAVVILLVAALRHRQNKTHRTSILVRAATWSAIVSVVLIAVTTIWSPHVHAWYDLHRVIPGASVIRAFTRISIFYTILFGICVAAIVTWLLGVRKFFATTLAVLMVAGLVLENIYGQTEVFARGDLERRVQPVIDQLELKKREHPCRVFLLTQADIPNWAHQLDASWASIMTGVPTINGYSGGIPRGWNFHNPQQASKKDVAVWASQFNVSLEDHDICLVQVDADGSANVK